MVAMRPLASMPLRSSEARRQVEPRGERAGDRRDERRDVERAVDRRQSALAGARLGDVDADDRGEGTDGRHDEREHEAVLAERDRAQDQRGHQGDGVGLEQVGRHAGAVADVVADVVGDGGGVARVVLGDALLDLADEVGADVSGLGEDAAANTHEHGEQRGAEAEALEHGGRFALEAEHDGGRTEQAEADRHHADVTAGAERDAHRGVAALALSGGGDADVRAHGEPHAGVADHGREDGTEDEEDGSPDLDLPVVVRGKEQEQERARPPRRARGS